MSRVAIGSDHAGYALKEALAEHLRERGLEVQDLGTDAPEPPSDYPAIVRSVCGCVLRERIPGVVLGGSGQGEAIAANKVPGIRAGRCLTTEDARLARSHNDCNVLALGGRMTDAETAARILDAFLTTDFDGGRHTARVENIEPGAAVPFFE